MSYKITYGNKQDLIRFQKKGDNHWLVIAAAFLCAFLLGVKLFIPDLFRAVVNTFSLWDVSTVAAFHVMVEEVHQGVAVSDAVDAFCRSVIENAGLWN